MLLVRLLKSWGRSVCTRSNTCQLRISCGTSTTCGRGGVAWLGEGNNNAIVVVVLCLLESKLEVCGNSVAAAEVIWP